MEISARRYLCRYDNTNITVSVALGLSRDKRANVNVEIQVPSFGINKKKDFTESGILLLQSHHRRNDFAYLIVSLGETEDKLKIQVCLLYIYN